jgi:hypothetical protein
MEVYPKAKFLYKYFEDYKRSSSIADKDRIFKEFLCVLWSTNHPRKIITKNISYEVADNLPGDIKSVFMKYAKITYITHQSKTKDKDSWRLLRQKINNLYTDMCDSEVCTYKDYLNLLHTAQNTYYLYIKGGFDKSATEVDTTIQRSMDDAQKLYEKYGKQKMKISWNEYKSLINGWLRKIFNNYIPFEDNENEAITVLPTALWSEDNYAVKYVCTSLSGYMKNYQKKYYGVREHQEYGRCDNCGNLFEKHCRSHRYCVSCQKQKSLEKYKRYNQKRVTTNGKDGKR